MIFECRKIIEQKIGNEKMPKKLDLKGIEIGTVTEEERELVETKRKAGNAEFYRKLAFQIMEIDEPEKTKIELGKLTLVQARSIVSELRRYLDDDFQFKPVAREKDNGSTFIGFVLKKQKE